ncbi:MAG: hypothetical protein HDR30_08050 [Lachnospiraceae bacterium]|nr:hypothetical protein [Lachnospiraceae bacterium]
MLKTICRIMIASVLMLPNQESTEQGFADYMIECIEAECNSRIYIPAISGRTVENAETLSEVQEELERLTTENIGIRIEDGSLDTSGLADGLANCWQQYQKKNYYVLSVDYMGEEEQGKEAMTPFLDKMEEDCIKILEKELAKQGGFPDYIRFEKLKGLDIYTFRINIPEKRDDEREYVVILNGTWENKEVCWQYVTFPTTGCSGYYAYDVYAAMRADINYDGFPDLLIREGYSGGSGGSWTNYRGIIWKEDLGKFVWYESFPAQVSHFLLSEQRMISHSNSGILQEYVVEYKVVDGEYVVTRELAWIAGMAESTLYYYEMGVLVKEYDTTDMSYWEMCDLYPDLDFWWKG